MQKYQRQKMLTTRKIAPVGSSIALFMPVPNNKGGLKTGWIAETRDQTEHS